MPLLYFIFFKSSLSHKTSLLDHWGTYSNTTVRNETNQQFRPIFIVPKAK